MKVVVAAGGTGGHIYPALSVIHKIKECEPNSEFLYIGTHNRMEKDIVPLEGIPFRSVEIYGFNKKNIFKNIKTVNCLCRSYKKCIKILEEFRPDVVLGFGGYVTVPVIMASHKLHLLSFIHEQNSIAGKSNMFLSKYVTKIGVSFSSSQKDFPKEKVIFTGNPCSEEALYQKKMDKKLLGLSENKKLVLIVMGSLGSSKINEIFIKCMHCFTEKEYEVVFISGKAFYENIKKEKFPKNVFVFPFIENLTRLMKNVDVIVSRAGASTISEIVTLSIPSVLIPSPYVANNHQYKNAMDLVDKKAAILLEEKNLNEQTLLSAIDQALISQNRIEIKKNLKSFAIKDSATKIYNIVKEMVDEKSDRSKTN